MGAFLFVSFLAGLFLIPIGSLWLLVCLIRNVGQARKYRSIMRALEKAQNLHIAGAGRSWNVVYKMNGVVRTMVVEGETEGDAVKAYIAKGGNPRGIVSME